MDVGEKREREKRMVEGMIALYCRKKHHSRGGVCPHCAALADYAHARSDACPFMAQKTFCSNCKVHCYRGDMRDEIRLVMRFAGPRMLLAHPVMAVRHLLEAGREKRALEEHE